MPALSGHSIAYDCEPREKKIVFFYVVKHFCPLAIRLPDPYLPSVQVILTVFQSVKASWVVLTETMASPSFAYVHSYVHEHSTCYVICCDFEPPHSSEV